MTDGYGKVILGYSCRTTLRRELFTFNLPLYSMKPSFLNLFMKKFTRPRVVPTISASVSWLTDGSRFRLVFFSEARQH